jgi:hypothetical protein
MPPKIRFVCATREDEQQFYAKTALGRSLALYRLPNVEVRLFASNTRGLPSVYNIALDESASDPAILVFSHDDVHLCDFYWHGQIALGIKSFDIIGLAGNKRRLVRQPAWAFVDTDWTWDSPQNLSGLIAHGKGFPPRNLMVYGAPCQEVKLLDGVMLIAHSETLRRAQIQFDERFEFHFYDMDLCRQAELRRLRMGTWCLSVVHESGGAFGDAAWMLAYEKYLQKWQT